MATKTRKRVQRKPIANAAPAPQPARKPNVSPQDQALYDQVMLAARKVIYGDPKNPADDMRFKMVMQRLQGGKDEIGVTIGQLTATVLSNVQRAIVQAGKQVPGYILFHAGLELIADLIQTAVAAKLMTDTQSADVTQQAVLEAMKTYKRAQALQTSAQPAQSQAAAPQPGAMPPPQQPGIINAARGA